MIFKGGEIAPGRGRAKAEAAAVDHRCGLTFSRNNDC